LSAPTSTQGIERLALYFAEVPTRQGVLARRSLGHPAPDDESVVRELIDDMQTEVPDGTSAGAVVPMIWRAHELLDLGCEGDEAGCLEVMEWILGHQEKPGAFNQGCSRMRHTHRVCEHFISGFFSPAPPEQRVAPVMLPNGKVFRAEPAARFAISCLALRAALRGRFELRPSVERHTASLLQLQEQWKDWNGYFAADMIVAGIHALAFVSQAQRGIQSRLASMIAAHQLEDGTWANADLFHTLEALLALGTTEAHAAIRRAVPALLARQRFDGSFGPTAQQERALIALRSLIWAEQDG
jgi:hypothetical protein